MISVTMRSIAATRSTLSPLRHRPDPSSAAAAISGAAARTESGLNAGEAARRCRSHAAPSTPASPSPQARRISSRSWRLRPNVSPLSSSAARTASGWVTTSGPARLSLSARTS
jgi:hypothetical protein